MNNRQLNAKKLCISVIPYLKTSFMPRIYNLSPQLANQELEKMESILKANKYK